MSRFDLFVTAWTIVGVLTAVYLVVGAINDARHRRYERRRAAVLGVLSVVLFADDRDAEAAHREVDGLPSNVMLDVLQTLAIDLDGEAQSRVRQLVRSAGLERFIRNRANARRWRLRVQAAQLHHLVDHPDFDRRALLVDRHPIVRARTAEAMTTDQATDHLDLLVPMLAADEPVVRLSAQQAVLRSGSAAVPALLEALAGSGPGTIAVLEVVMNLADPRLATGLGPYCRAGDPRIRQMAARALGNTATEDSSVLLDYLLTDPDGTVRSTACESLARLEAVSAANQIGHRLADTDFIVRRAAGLALDELGSPGRLVLRRALESADLFARDMARQVLDSSSTRMGVDLLPASAESLARLDEDDPFAALLAQIQADHPELAGAAARRVAGAGSTALVRAGSPSPIAVGPEDIVELLFGDRRQTDLARHVVAAALPAGTALPAGPAQPSLPAVPADRRSDP